MQFGAVTFVLAETIVGKMDAEVTHHSVAGDLGDHASRGNAQAETIAIDDRRLWKRERENGKTVDEHMVGLEA